MRFQRTDICSAYWLFGSLYHSGQNSKEYRDLCRALKCGFNPGPNFRYDLLTNNGREIFDRLVSHVIKIPKQAKALLHIGDGYKIVPIV